jgi:GH15 family glucan-1,4-alpha-glucosidase
MLVSRIGPRLQPGTRSYSRSWIRDGAMMSEALLQLGQQELAASYFDWFAPYQFETGKVPCCVDARGADPDRLGGRLRAAHHRAVRRPGR